MIILTEEQKDQLRPWIITIRNYMLHQISPINSQMIELMALYESFGFEPLPRIGCSGCSHICLSNLNDLIIEHKL